MSGLDVATRMRRTLLANATAAGVPIAITRSYATRWASATFTGARHELALRAEATEPVGRWLAELAEAELAVAGHLVADLKIVAMTQVGTELSVTLEILTLEER